MDFWIIPASFVIFYFLLEFLFYFIVLFVRKHFQWLIVKSDENPLFSKDGLSKFIQEGYDSELGWVRKPNTTKKEKAIISGHYIFSSVDFIKLKKKILENMENPNDFDNYLKNEIKKSILRYLKNLNLIQS